jgi:hypothetical protein
MTKTLSQISEFSLQTSVAVVAFLACTSALARPAWADGYEFFTVDRGRPVNLVYVGQIRDRQSGRIVRAPAYFMVTEKRSGMTFPFVNDRPGHYRSPDIGESVEELAGLAVNPSDLEFEVSVAGYKNLKLATVPRKNKGVVEVNFKVERQETPAATAAPDGTTASELVDHSVQAPTEGQADETRSRSFRLLFMGVASATIIAGAAARTLGRRQSTAG